MSIRNAASAAHVLHVRVLPRGARCGPVGIDAEGFADGTGLGASGFMWPPSITPCRPRARRHGSQYAAIEFVALNMSVEQNGAVLR